MAMVSRCTDEDVLIEVMELLMPYSNGNGNGNGGRKSPRRTDDDTRAAMVADHEAGMTYPAIASKYNVCASTVARFCQMAKKARRVKGKAKKGREVKTGRKPTRSKKAAKR